MSNRLEAARREWTREHGPIGYSENMEPLEDWKEKGMTCPYEHCIERSPLRLEQHEGSCPVYGHDCPGGASKARACRERPF
jgi:hypothetical protein